MIHNKLNSLFSLRAVRLVRREMKLNYDLIKVHNFPIIPMRFVKRFQ